MKKFFFIIKTLLMYILISNPSYAQKGETCDTLPVTGIYQYASKNTIYNLVLEHIDMKNTLKDGRQKCKNFNDELNICIRKNEASNEYTEITLNKGSIVNISSYLDQNTLTKYPTLKNTELHVDEFFYKTLCISLPTPKGMAPILCKKIISPQEEELDELKDTSCKIQAKSCYFDTNKSKTNIHFSGRLIDCVTESLDRVFFEDKICHGKTKHHFLTSFPRFQKYLKNAVFAALCIYTIIFGLNLIMNPANGNLSTFTLFAIKIILVAYFGVGSGFKFFNKNNIDQHNGFTEFGLPFFKSAINQFAHIVFNSSGSKGLCSFNKKDYEPKYSHYALWDSIDCRFFTYLGVNLPEISDNMGIGNLNSSIFGNAPYPLRFFKVLVGILLIDANILLFAYGIIFSLFLFTMIVHFISTYLVCLLTLYAMAYISPIFITFSLFSYTKENFKSWLKICLSCALQPAIVVGFTSFALTIYDSSIYGNCEFHPVQKEEYKTFEISAPVTNQDKCLDSLGVKLLHYFTDNFWDERNFLLFQLNYVRDDKKISINLLYAMIVGLIIFYFSSAINQFASDVTEGPLLGSVVQNPLSAVKGLMDQMKNKVASTEIEAKDSSSGPDDSKQAEDVSSKSKEKLEESADKMGEKATEKAADYVGE